jgi:hypothetical protein
VSRPSVQPLTMTSVAAPAMSRRVFMMASVSVH